jgi:hypothetical protein
MSFTVNNGVTQNQSVAIKKAVDKVSTKSGHLAERALQLKPLVQIDTVAYPGNIPEAESKMNEAEARNLSYLLKLKFDAGFMTLHVQPKIQATEMFDLAYKTGTNLESAGLMLSSESAQLQVVNLH